MHKGQKCIQTLWDCPKKNPFVEKYKEYTICAILREKTHFGAYPEAEKGVGRAHVRSKCSAEAQKNANPCGLSEKKRLFCRKSAILSIRGKYQF